MQAVHARGRRPHYRKPIVPVVYKTRHAHAHMSIHPVLGICLALAAATAVSALAPPAAAARHGSLAAHIEAVHAAAAARQLQTDKFFTPLQHNQTHVNISPIWAAATRQLHADKFFTPPHHNQTHLIPSPIWDFFNTSTSTTRQHTIWSDWAHTLARPDPALRRVHARCAFCNNSTHTRRKTGQRLSTMRANRTAIRLTASSHVLRQHTLWV